MSKMMNFRLPTRVEDEIEYASSRRTLLSPGDLVRALLCSAAPRVRLVELLTSQVSIAETVGNRSWLRSVSKSAQGTWLAKLWLGSVNATPGRGGGFRGPAPLTSHGMVLPPKPFGNWLEGHEGLGVQQAQSFSRSFAEVSWGGLGQSHRPYDEEWPALERVSCPLKGSTREPEVRREQSTPRDRQPMHSVDFGVETVRPTGMGRGCLSLLRATPGWEPQVGNSQLPVSVLQGGIGAFQSSVPPVVGAVRESPIPTVVAAADTNPRGGTLSGVGESISCKRPNSGRDEGVAVELSRVPEAAPKVLPLSPRPRTGEEPSEAEVIPSSDEPPAKKKRPSKKTKRPFPCQIPGCGEPTRFLKKHIFQKHAPGIFDESIPLTSELCNLRLRALQTVVARIGCSMDNLLNELNKPGRIFPGAEVTPSQYEQMAALAESAGWGVPERFEFYPMNSPAMLTHWRALQALAMLQPDSLMAEFREQFSVSQLAGMAHQSPTAVPPEKGVLSSPGEREHSAPSNLLCSEEQREIPVLAIDAGLPADHGREEASNEDHSELQPVFDSHFHLDRTCKDLNIPLSSTLDEIRTRVGEPDPWLRVGMRGCTLVFCDPETYPTLGEIDQLAWQGFTVAIGLHPKKVSSNEFTLAADVDVLTRLLSSPQVGALGEVGLDYSRGPSRRERERQENTLVGLVKLLSSPLQVLVLHCRDQESRGRDYCQVGRPISALERCLELLSPYLPRTQRIHLHCFKGSSGLVNAWLGRFPNTHFGFTGLVRSFSSNEREAVRQVPNNRLLLETDGPYFRPDGRFSVNAPHLLGYVARAVATILEKPISEVITLTCDNASRLYAGGNLGESFVHEEFIPTRFPNVDQPGLLPYSNW